MAAWYEDEEKGHVMGEQEQDGEVAMRMADRVHGAIRAWQDGHLEDAQRQLAEAVADTGMMTTLGVMAEIVRRALGEIAGTEVRRIITAVPASGGAFAGRPVSVVAERIVMALINGQRSEATRLFDGYVVTLEDRLVVGSTDRAQEVLRAVLRLVADHVWQARAARDRRGGTAVEDGVPAEVRVHVEEAFRAACEVDSMGVGRALEALAELEPDWVVVAQLMTGPLRRLLMDRYANVCGGVGLGLLGVEMRPRIGAEEERDNPGRVFALRLMAAAHNGDDGLCRALFGAFAGTRQPSGEDPDGRMETVLTVLVEMVEQFKALGGRP